MALARSMKTAASWFAPLRNRWYCTPTEPRREDDVARCAPVRLRLARLFQAIEALDLGARDRPTLFLQARTSSVRERLYPIIVAVCTVTSNTKGARDGGSV